MSNLLDARQPHFDTYRALPPLESIVQRLKTSGVMRKFAIYSIQDGRGHLPRAITYENMHDR